MNNPEGIEYDKGLSIEPISVEDTDVFDTIIIPKQGSDDKLKFEEHSRAVGLSDKHKIDRVRRELNGEDHQEISPAIREYFKDKGRDNVFTILSRFSPQSIESLKKAILSGNLGHVVHFMQTAEAGSSYKKMALDITSLDPGEQERGREMFGQFIGRGFATSANYEKIDQKLPQGAGEIVDMLFAQK